MLWNTVLALTGLRANLTYRPPGPWSQRRAARETAVDLWHCRGGGYLCPHARIRTV